MARMLSAGADDYLTKPFSLVQLPARVRAALRLKDAQDRSEQLHQRLLTVNAELERNLAARQGELVRTRDGLVLALIAVAEERTGETTEHVLRLRRYCRRLAEEAATMPAHAGKLDAVFLDTLEGCVPLHDLGMAGLPDNVLRNPGKLSSEDRLLMQAHTTLGAAALEKVVRRYGATAFLRMAIDVVRHHHERWDGGGYPERLAGNRIPLAARLFRFGDVYDSLRCRRSHRPAFGHLAAVNLISNASPGQFDPGLLQVFQRCAADFEQIFRELPDGKKS
jgi:response regulator RpfG family c-di-GMP phosphodiesterase